MEEKKYIQKGLFHKVVSVDGKNKFEMPSIYSFQLEKNGFYLKRSGSIITPKLCGIYERDVLPKGYFVGVTVDGHYILFDLETGNVSQKYVQALKEGREIVVVTAENEIVSLNDKLVFVRTGYTYVGRLGEKRSENSKIATNTEEDLTTPFCVVKKGSQYGIMNRGEIICPAEFYTPNISIEKSNEFYLAQSCEKQMLVSRTGKILLVGNELYNVVDKGTYLSFEESRNGQLPYYASYNKNSDTTTLYGYSWANGQYFIELTRGDEQLSVPGRVRELCKLFDEYFLVTETKKNGSELVSLSGDMRIVGEEPQENLSYIMYSRKPSQIGKPLNFAEITNKSTLVQTNVPYAQLVVFKKDGAYGAFDLNTRRIAVPAKYQRIYVVVQDEYGNYRSVVENKNEKCGVVDEAGNSLIHLKYKLGGIQRINFGKDGATHFVVKFAYTTTSGSDFVYVDPETEEILASDVAIKRYREAAGEMKKNIKSENEIE